MHFSRFSRSQIARGFGNPLRAICDLLRLVFSVSFDFKELLLTIKQGDLANFSNPVAHWLLQPTVPTTLHTTGDAKDEIETLRTMYQVQVTRSEHYENQRATLTNLILTLASALVALATFDGSVSARDQETGLLMSLIGVFGFVASTVHSRRARRHGKRAEAYRNALDERLPKATINATRRQVPEENLLLDRVWDYVHIAIMIIGILLVLLARFA